MVLSLPRDCDTGGGHCHCHQPLHGCSFATAGAAWAVSPWNLSGELLWRACSIQHSTSYDFPAMGQQMNCGCYSATFDLREESPPNTKKSSSKLESLVRSQTTVLGEGVSDRRRHGERGRLLPTDAGAGLPRGRGHRLQHRAPTGSNKEPIRLS